MKIQAIFWITVVTFIMIIFQGCGVDGARGPAGKQGPPGHAGPPGEQGPPGEVVEIPAEEIEEGLAGGLACIEEALPDYFLKSLSINEDKGEISIKLKEKEGEE